MTIKQRPNFKKKYTAKVSYRKFIVAIQKYGIDASYILTDIL